MQHDGFKIYSTMELLVIRVVPAEISHTPTKVGAVLLRISGTMDEQTWYGPIKYGIFLFIQLHLNFMLSSSEIAQLL